MGPILLEENEEVVELFEEVQNQLRVVAMGTIIGIDYNILYIEANRMGVDISPCVKEKIKILESIHIASLNSDKE